MYFFVYFWLNLVRGCTKNILGIMMVTIILPGMILRCYSVCMINATDNLLNRLFWYLLSCLIKISTDQSF